MEPSRIAGHSERSEEPRHFVFVFAVARSLILYPTSEPL
jgi:hypothetical protein